MTAREKRYGLPLGLCVVLLSGCGLFGANFPPGTAGGSFVEEPTGLPTFSTTMNQRRETLQRGVESHLDINMDVLRDLFRSSTSLRGQLKNQKVRLNEKSKNEEELSALDTQLVLQAVHWLIELDVLLFNMWTSYRNYLPYSSEPDSYAPSRGASLLDSSVRFKGGLLAVVAEIVRMDNADAVIRFMRDEPILTQWLNRGDATLGIPPESFDRMLGSFRDPDRRALLEFHLDAIFGDEGMLLEFENADPQIAFLLAVLRESRTARKIRQESTVARQWHFTRVIVSRSLALIFSPALEAYIALKFRDSEASNLDKLAYLKNGLNVPENIYDMLEPLDLILVEDPRLGGAEQGYNRAVVYLGDYRWLRDTNVADTPGYTANLAQLRQGDTFLSLDESGIRLSGYAALMDNQDIALVRLSKANQGTSNKAIDASSPVSSEVRFERQENLKSLYRGQTGVAVDEITETKTPTARVKADQGADAPNSLALGSKSELCARPEKILENAFKTLTDPDFLSPALRSSSEYGALLLFTIYGSECFNEEPLPAQQTPSWVRLLDGMGAGSEHWNLRVATENANLSTSRDYEMIYQDHLSIRKDKQK